MVSRVIINEREMRWRGVLPPRLDPSPSLLGFRGFWQSVVEMVVEVMLNKSMYSYSFSF